MDYVYMVEEREELLFEREGVSYTKYTHDEPNVIYEGESLEEAKKAFAQAEPDKATYNNQGQRGIGSITYGTIELNRYENRVDYLEFDKTIDYVDGISRKWKMAWSKTVRQHGKFLDYEDDGYWSFADEVGLYDEEEEEEQ